jgi:hypothetical protein
MNQIEVGQLYLPPRTEYPEGCEFNFYDGGYQLNLYWDNPNKQEIQAVQKGKANFSLLIHEQIIFLLYQFKPLLWGDAPYHYSLVPVDRRSSPKSIEEGQGVLLTIILIDARTGIVRAIRIIGLSTNLSRKLVDAIAIQVANPIAPQDYSNRVDQAYSKYPNTIDMVLNAQRRS